MAARPVQVSLDSELLRRIDADPEVRERGRSAFVRAAVQLYLEAKEHRVTDAHLSRAYAGEADTMLAEIEPWIRGQAWPPE